MHHLSLMVKDVTARGNGLPRKLHVVRNHAPWMHSARQVRPLQVRQKSVRVIGCQLRLLPTTLLDLQRNRKSLLVLFKISHTHHSLRR